MTLITLPCVRELKLERVTVVSDTHQRRTGILLCQWGKVQLDKMDLQRQDSTFLGLNSSSWINISKNKFETGLHLCLWPGKGNWNQEAPQPLFEMFQNNKMCVCEDCSINNAAKRECVCTHHPCTYHPEKPCQRWCWNPGWWPRSSSLFSYLSFFLSLSLNHCCHGAVQAVHMKFKVWIAASTGSSKIAVAMCCSEKFKPLLPQAAQRRK